MPNYIIDPDYRSSIIFAIYRYQVLKPTTRTLDVERCLFLVDQEYDSPLELRYVLTKYLDAMRTGFHFLGLKSLPIKTGRSLLRSFILEALESKSEDELLAYKAEKKQQVKTLDKGTPRSELVEQNEALSTKLTRMQQKLQLVEEKLHEWIMEYKAIAVDKEQLEKKLTDSIGRVDQLSINNVELNHTLLAVSEEKNALMEVNKRLQQRLERQGVTPGDVAFFRQPRVTVTPL
jgi:hypothetical protein